jgi:Protein of unknown function (DUF3306)
MSSDGFLSRWSRRKQEVREAERPERVEPAQPIEGRHPSEADAPDQKLPAAAPDELSPEEIARLPAPEELTADMDLSLFLRKGVPEALRKAALRRMWALDPKIRDFVSEAREYAYDWNTLGGVPGSGVLPPSDEIARMAARIVGGADPAEHTAAATPSQDRDHVSSSAHTETHAQAQQDIPSTNEAATVSSSSPDEKPQETEAATRPNPTQEPANVASPPRRHGGAMPL